MPEVNIYMLSMMLQRECLEVTHERCFVREMLTALVERAVLLTTRPLPRHPPTSTVLYNDSKRTVAESSASRQRDSELEH